MNILVTGAAGFLGSNLCKRLLEEGNNVWAVDNFLTGVVDSIEQFKDNKNFKFFECGVEEKSFLDFCENSGVIFDRVYHLACATGVPNIETLSEEMLLACSTGTFNVMSVAKKSNARVLFTSSSEVYGEPQKTPQDESYTGNVETTGWRASYEEGKRFSETIVSHFVRKFNLPAMTVRLFNVYGPNMSLEDTRVIPRFAVQSIGNMPITVQGNGEQSRTFCFVSDILDGFEAVIEKGIPGEVYNLGSDKLITVRELADMVVNISKSSSEVSYIKRPNHDHSSRMPNLDKIKALGWEMRVDLEDGINRTLDDFKARLSLKDKTKDFLGQEVEKSKPTQ